MDVLVHTPYSVPHPLNVSDPHRLPEPTTRNPGLFPCGPCPRSFDELTFCKLASPAAFPGSDPSLQHSGRSPSQRLAASISSIPLPSSLLVHTVPSTAKRPSIPCRRGPSPAAAAAAAAASRESPSTLLQREWRARRRYSVVLQGKAKQGACERDTLRDPVRGATRLSDVACLLGIRDT